MARKTAGGDTVGEGCGGRGGEEWEGPGAGHYLDSGPRSGVSGRSVRFWSPQPVPLGDLPAGCRPSGERPAGCRLAGS